MNIRVNLNTNIADGSEVVFRSPADCSQVTGLVIYHNGGKTEFAFADAHGHNVGDIDHLFAENAVVKVILDVTAGMAFVQNADTNVYIESTFIKSVNGVKPDANGNVEISIPEGGGGSGTPGQDGKDGKDGKDGGFYIPHVEQIDVNTIQISFTGSNEEMVPCMSEAITLPRGADGEKGDQGLPGEKGEKGDKGDTGEKGANGTSPTVSVVKITGGHRISITDALGTKTVDVLDGSDGKNGADGKNGSDGKTPVVGVDYFTETDKKDIVARTILSLKDGGLIGFVDENNHILLSGSIADGVYTLKYENEDGTTTDIGSLTIGTVEAVNLLKTALTPNDITSVFDGNGYKNGYYASAAEPFYNTDAEFFCTGLMPIPDSKIFYVKGCTIDTTLSHTRFGLMKEDGGTINTATVANWTSNGATIVVTKLGEQYYSIDLTHINTTTVPFYFYFSASGTGDNVIVSHTPIS